MTLFQSLLKTRTSQDSHHEVQISEDLRRLELESQSRRDGLANISNALSAYSNQIEKQYIPATLALSKALIQQGKFYQERNEYSQMLVRLGEALAEKAERERQSTVVDLQKRLTELMALGSNLEKAQKDVEARRAALEDRKAKLAKKPKPELEEQVRGAEMLLKEATDKMESMMSVYAQQEESLLLEPIGNFLQQLSSNVQQLKAPPVAPQRMPSVRKQLPSPPPLPQEIIVVSKNSGQASPTTTIAPIVIPNIPVEQPKPELRPEPKKEQVIPQEPEVSDYDEEPATPEEESKQEEVDAHDNVHIDQEKEDQPALPRKVKAVFSFEGEGNELSFEKGQTILLLKSMNDGWCLGELDGVQGIFPANYVKDVPSSAPKDNNKTPQMMPKPAQLVPKPSASKTVTLDFDDSPNQREPSISNDDDQQPSSPLSPTHSEPRQQSTTRAFSYIPQMPPNGFAGLRKANTSNASKELLENKEEAIVESVADCKECGCKDYTENVFKRGSCNNCFHFH